MLTLKQLLRRLRLIAEDWHVPPFLEIDVEFNPRHKRIVVWVTVRNHNAKTLDLVECVLIHGEPLFVPYQQFQAAVVRLTDQLQAVIQEDMGEGKPPRDACGPLFDVELMGRDQ